ncbi:MAG: hypothetical protein MI749_17050 [Desulfovibrionales bacterium]|nr:hypothetical protein [Desulfovibrionales bacterium]
MTIKKWQTLTWEDFQGIPKPFTGWAAGISSDIYLEYDSLKQQYIAFAGQNNQQSWTKESTKNSDYALNHEQYHFNITEIHARKMNRYIQENPDQKLWRYKSKLNGLKKELRKMQKQYDHDSDHSLNQDMQAWWEYRIDSLLLALKDSNVLYTDYLGGARLFFPKTPEFALHVNSNGDANLKFTVSAHNITYSLMCYKLPQLSDNDKYMHQLLQFYDSGRYSLMRHEEISESQDLDFSVMVADTVASKTFHIRWVKSGNMIYQLAIMHPTTTGQTTGYEMIAQSYFSSFEAIDTEKYWIDKFKNANTDLYKVSVSSVVALADDPENPVCYENSHDSPACFYKGPFYSDDGDLFIIARFADSVIRTDNIPILVFNDMVYGKYTEGNDEIYFVPAQDLPQESFSLTFGYYNDSKTESGCIAYYYEYIEVDPKFNMFE